MREFYPLIDRLLLFMDRALLAVLFIYGLVAVLLTAGATFTLRIIPSLVLGFATLALILWWSGGRKFAGATPEQSGEWKRSGQYWVREWPSGRLGGC